MFPSVHQSVRPSRYLLLNHWVEFNQTCYMTSTRGKGVREQHIFFTFLCLVVKSVGIYADVPANDCEI